MCMYPLVCSEIIANIEKANNNNKTKTKQNKQTKQTKNKIYKTTHVQNVP